MRRTAPEEWNLSANFQEQDPTCAEFLRTYRSVEFPGGQLIRRLESEQQAQPMRETWKFLPGDGTTTTMEKKFSDNSMTFMDTVDPTTRFTS